DGVQAGPEDEFGGGQLADAVRAAGARDGVLRGGGAGLAGAVLGAAPDLDEPGAAAAAAQRLADGGDGDGVVPGEFARAAAGGARAVDDDTGVDGVEEPGEGAGAAGGEVEADVGVVAAAEGGELDGRVGEQAVGDEAAEVTVGSDQQDSHRAAPSTSEAAGRVIMWVLLRGCGVPAVGWCRAGLPVGRDVGGVGGDGCPGGGHAAARGRASGGGRVRPGVRGGDAPVRPPVPGSAACLPVGRPGRSSRPLRVGVGGGPGEAAGGVDQQDQGRDAAAEGGHGGRVPGRDQGFHRGGQRGEAGEAGGEDGRQGECLGGRRAREQHPRAVGEAVDGEEPGQVEQGPRGEGAGDGEGLVEGRGTQGEEARQGAEEQGDGGEQQGAHGGGEVRQSAARGEFAAGPAGEEVGGPGGGGTGQREGEHGGRGERPVPVGGGRAVGAPGDGDLEEPIAQQGVADEPPGPAGHAGGRGAVGPAQRAAAQGGPDGRGEGDDADGGREEPGLAVGVAQGEHRGEAQGAGEQREDDPVGPRLQGCGGGGAGGVAVAGHAGEEFLGEGEDVAVPEAGGGPVGDAVGLQAGGDL